MALRSTFPVRTSKRQFRNHIGSATGLTSVGLKPWPTKATIQVECATPKAVCSFLDELLPQQVAKMVANACVLDQQGWQKGNLGTVAGCLQGTSHFGHASTNESLQLHSIPGFITFLLQHVTKTVAYASAQDHLVGKQTLFGDSRNKAYEEMKQWQRTFLYVNPDHTC
jgi:hypothetical protein